MREQKIWLTGMTNAGNGQHLEELIEPIKKYFDGFVWVYHDQNDFTAKEPEDRWAWLYDDGYNYLAKLTNSKVILAPWCNRTDFSRNIGLYHGPIKYGDWFMTIDTLERMHEDFAKQLPELIQRFDRNGIDGVFLRNKHFLFKFNEQTAYIQNPHSGVSGINQSLEITSLPFWKDEYWQNVRHLHRDKHAFIDHNLKYYLFPNTNHLVLACENDPEFIKLRYQVRSKFLNELDGLNIDIQNFEEVKEYLIKGEYTDGVKSCVATEKYLNDVYRFYVNQDKEIKDDFNFNDLVKVL